ncbi:hypothetical protein NCC49_002370 [Naganishia albida]|nr:hypothetical protein NCC49_002370 [Naganishia albida]
MVQLRPQPGALVRLLAPKPDIPDSERENPSFPLQFRKRRKGLGYYIALGVVVLVFGTPWVCTGWLVAYAIWARKWKGLWGVGAFLGVLYATAEILFFLYLKYITSIIQRPAPPSNLTPDQCLAVFVKMLQTGMQDAITPGASPTGKEPVPSAQDIQERLEDALSLAKTGQPDASHHHEHGKPSSRTRSKMRGVASRTTAVTDSASPSTSLGLRRRQGQSQTPTPLDIRFGNLESDGIQSPMVRLRRLEKDDPRAIEFREKMRNWFGRVPWDSITRTDVLHWLAWSCCNLTYETASKSSIQMALLEASIELLEARTGTTFTDYPFGKDGTDSSPPARKEQSGPTQEDMKTIEGRAQARVRDMVKLMRLTLDPVNTRTRPLSIYAIKALAETRLRKTVYRDKLGFELHRQGDMDYMLRLPADWTPEKQAAEGCDPVLYLHGLGFGLTSIQNIHVVQTLVQRLPDVPIIVPIQPHISMHVFHPRHLKPPLRHEMVKDVRAICKRWGFWTEGPLQSRGVGGKGPDEKSARRGIAILSHSNGSIAHGWLIKDCAEMILRNALVDPVVFCLWEGDVCYNFCYREPHSAIELLLHWFIASEIGIANSIQRHFDWSANTLFHDEIPGADDPKRTLVVLGGEDVIIDTWRVKGYLNRHGMRDSLFFDPVANHGEGLRGEPLERIMAFLKPGAM